MTSVTEWPALGLVIITSAATCRLGLAEVRPAALLSVEPLNDQRSAPTGQQPTRCP